MYREGLLIAITSISRMLVPCNCCWVAHKSQLDHVIFAYYHEVCVPVVWLAEPFKMADCRFKRQMGSKWHVTSILFCLIHLFSPLNLSSTFSLQNTDQTPFLGSQLLYKILLHTSPSKIHSSKTYFIVLQ